MFKPEQGVILLGLKNLVLIFTGTSQISVSCQRVWEDHQFQNSRTSKGTVANRFEQIVEVGS